MSNKIIFCWCLPQFDLKKVWERFFGLFFLAFLVVTKAERYSLLKIFKEIKEMVGKISREK